MSDLSFEQQPAQASDKVPVITNWLPALTWVLYQDDSIAAYFYYKLILEVYLGTVAGGTLIAKIKLKRNGFAPDVTNDKARAYFDIRDLVNTQLTLTTRDMNNVLGGSSSQPFGSIHKVGANAGYLDKIFSRNDNQILSFQVKGYEEFSTSATTSPEEETGDAQTGTELYYIAASLPLFTVRGTDAQYSQGTAFASYTMSTALGTEFFLSDLKESVAYDLNRKIIRSYVQDNDYGTLAFLNDRTSFNSRVVTIRVLYYDSSNSLLSTSNFTNASAAGGEPPTGTLTNALRLLFFGACPGNLEGQSIDTDARPSNNSGWAYYTVHARDGDNVAVSALYYFVKQDASCKGFKVRRLGWRNSFGCYDYFNFKMKSVQTLDLTRHKYETMLGYFSSSKYYYNDYGRGKNTLKVDAVLKETLQTDYITTEDAELLEGLVQSNEVYIIENDDTSFTQAVNVTDKSFIKKTSANDNLIQYAINIEYANNVNTNS